MNVSFLSNISVNELIDSIIRIDNGYMDNWAEQRDKYECIGQIRSKLINELIDRYLGQKCVGEDNNLERAYQLYLRFYI
jgi:hypothetical protein